MIYHNHFVRTIVAASALTGSAWAGGVETAPAARHHGGDWCENLKTFGQLYKNEDGQFIQGVKFFGRFQYNYAYINGNDVNGDNFDQSIDEIRRFRLGAEIKFLNGFKLKGNVNLIEDEARSGGGSQLAYQDFDELLLSYTKKDIAGLDAVTFFYGRHKVAIGHESHTSSKKLKTVERSALSNKIYGNRYTGFTLVAERGDWEGAIGYYSLDENDALGSLDNHGHALYVSSRQALAGGALTFDFFYNLASDKPQGSSGGDELGVGYKWVASATYEKKFAGWNLAVNAVYGNNGSTDYTGKADRGGSFYGLMVMPSTYLIEDRLEFVARYSYQGSERSEGIRAYSRYFRASVHGGDVSGGRGDSHHSLYAGLNWYLCDHNSKVQLGIEYDTLETSDGNADATTLWAAYRMYF